MATVAIKNGNVVLVTLPRECQLPSDDSAYACSTENTNYVASVKCEQHQGRAGEVLMRMNIGKTVPALETFTFTVGGIRNPYTTKPSSALRVQIFEDDTMKSVTNEDAGNLRVITSVPYDVPYFGIKANITGAGLPATYTLTMSVVHDILPGGGLLIRYPPEVVAEKGTPIEVEVNAAEYYEGKTVVPLTKPFIDYSARMLLFNQDNF